MDNTISCLPHGAFVSILDHPHSWRYWYSTVYGPWSTEPDEYVRTWIGNNAKEVLKAGLTARGENNDQQARVWLFSIPEDRLGTGDLKLTFSNLSTNKSFPTDWPCSNEMTYCLFPSLHAMMTTDWENGQASFPLWMKQIPQYPLITKDLYERHQVHHLPSGLSYDEASRSYRVPDVGTLFSMGAELYSSFSTVQEYFQPVDAMEKLKLETPSIHQAYVNP